MEAQELRIGNWVRTPAGYEQVIDVMCDSINTMRYNGITYDDIQPIPLSPLILEKCGFAVFENKSNIDGVECRLEIDHKTMFTSCGKLNGGLVVMGLCGGNYFMKNIEFLHDLQNVYYSITQTELNIKL